MKGTLITFSGLDGSGKSTLSRGLVESLRGRGVACQYIWARYGSTFIDGLVQTYKQLLLRGRNRSSTNQRYEEAKVRFMRNRLLGNLYLAFVLVHYFGQITRKVALPLRRGTNLVCDRYVFDSLVDLAANLELPDTVLLRLLRAALRVAPRPDLAYLVEVPIEVALDRKADIPSQDYVVRRRALFGLIRAEYPFVRLNGTSVPSELAAAVLQQAAACLSGLRP